MARLATKPVEGEWDMQDGEDFKDYSKRTDGMFKALTDAAATVPEGSVVGLLMSFPIADGCATYRVSKESPLTLEHVPYGDAWQIPYAHIRGIRKADALEQARRERAMAKAVRPRLWPNG